MNYFLVLGTVFGLAALLKPVYMHVLPWDERAFIAKTYDARRPAWIVPVAAWAQAARAQASSTATVAGSSTPS